MPLNDRLLVGPTVNTSLIDVLLGFRQHKVTLTSDMSKIYRAVLLAENQRDHHRFAWRQDMKHPFKDHTMMRLTFGVSASAFATNMAMQQTSTDYELRSPQLERAVLDAFYVDDGLTGADSIVQLLICRSSYKSSSVWEVLN